MDANDDRKLTWAALLGRWVEFARSALALPDDAVGRSLRRVVPDIIGLQAISLALGEAADLDDDELALALDRARLLIERHSETIAVHLPEGDPLLDELIADARASLAEAEAEQAKRRGGNWA